MLIRRLARLGLQLMIATLLALLLYTLPLVFYIIADGPPSPTFQLWWGSSLSFLLVLYIGKTLYDTLFFDHYQR